MPLLFKAVAELQRAVGVVRAFAPLPRAVNPAVPTTGYDDVKRVALARLVVDNVPSIQVDWSLYGPKLAQVALTVGADDVDAVSAEDDTSEGPPPRAARGDPAQHPSRPARSRSSATAASISYVPHDARSAWRRRLSECAPARATASSARRGSICATTCRPSAPRLLHAARHRRRADSVDRISARAEPMRSCRTGDHVARAGRVGRALHATRPMATSGRSRWTPARARRSRLSRVLLRAAVQDRAGHRSAMAPDLDAMLARADAALHHRRQRAVPRLSRNRR